MEIPVRSGKKAYDNHETSCEKLGSVHLLSHGIWAFKVKGEKAETDLIYPEQPLDELLIRRTASTLVFTEWKLIKSHGEIDKKSREAIKQMEEYTSGLLTGLELRNTRYVILISKKQLTIPNDQERNGIKYRHINIPVTPLTPSESARKS
jgi:hypothetical protein